MGQSIPIAYRACPALCGFQRAFILASPASSSTLIIHNHQQTAHYVPTGAQYRRYYSSCLCLHGLRSQLPSRHVTARRCYDVRRRRRCPALTAAHGARSGTAARIWCSLRASDASCISNETLADGMPKT
eukprot:6179161-Pleurochrysis_carterae.AAC.2